MSSYFDESSKINSSPTKGFNPLNRQKRPSIVGESIGSLQGALGHVNASGTSGATGVLNPIIFHESHIKSSQNYWQQDDIPPNYNLYSLDKILSIKTGLYDTRRANAQTNINKDFVPLDTQSDISTISSKVSMNYTLPSPTSVPGYASPGTGFNSSNGISSPTGLSDDIFAKLESVGSGGASEQNATSSITASSHFYDESMDIPNFDDIEKSPSRNQQESKVNKSKPAPISNYDDYNSPSSDSDSDDSSSRIRKSKNKGILDDFDESLDDDYLSNKKSPRKDNKKKKPNLKRVSIKNVCNTSINGGFHIIALYLSNDILVLRFEARSGVSVSEDHYGGAIVGNLDDDSISFSHGNQDPIKGMGRYSDGEDDNDSVTSGSTLKDHNEFHQYRKLLRHYKQLSQSHWSSNNMPQDANKDTSFIGDQSNHLTMPAPIIRTITYFRDNGIHIDEMVIEEKFLICIDKKSTDGDIYILPLCKIIFPYVEDNVWPFKVQRQSVSNDIYYNETGSSFADGLSSTDYVDDNIPDTNPDDIPSLLNYTQLVFESFKSQENLLSTIKDITKISSKNRKFNIKKHGFITCSLVWKTFYHKYYLILGTSLGYLIFLNLHSQIEECIIPISNQASIKSFFIISDRREEYKYLAITCVSNSYSRPSTSNILSNFTTSNNTSTSKNRGKFFYKQVLEQKDMQTQTCKNICEYKLFSQLSTTDGSTVSMNSRMDHIIFATRPLMEGEEFKSDSENLSISQKLESYTLTIYEDSEKGPMLCMFNSIDNRLSIYDPLSTRFPLYIFQLNSDTHKVFVTDNLLITAQSSTQLRSVPHPQHIWIISRLLANALQNSNTSGESHLISPHWTLGQHQSKKSASVFQDFQLPQRQKILGILPGYHLKELNEHQKESSNFLEGCIIWTQNSVYEMRQNCAPFYIFKKILRHPTGMFGEKSDQFGKTFKLDIFKIYEYEGDRAFKSMDYKRAFALYDFSFISEQKRVEKLMLSHQLDGVIDYLSGLLSNPQNLQQEKRRELSDLLFFAYLNKIISTNEITFETKGNDIASPTPIEQNLDAHSNIPKDKKLENNLFDRGIGNQPEFPVNPNLWKKFRKFLLESIYYNPLNALEKLIDKGFIAIALEVANHGNIIQKALTYLLSKNITTLSDECLDFLFHRSYATDVVSTGLGVLLHNASPTQQIRFYLESVKKSRNLLENALKKQRNAPGVRYYSREEIQQLNDPTFSIDLDKIFFHLIHFITEEMLLLEIAQTFNPETTIFDTNNDYGFTLNSGLSPEIRQRQHENRESLFYFPFFSLQSHAEIFLISMIRLVTMKQSEDASLQTGQKKTSNISPGTFSHAYLHRNTQEKLEENMQRSAHLYRAQFILSICLKYQNIEAICRVYEENDMWMESLTARLNHIKLKASTFKEDQTIQYIFNVLERFFLLPKIQKSSNRVVINSHLILKVFKFWKDNISDSNNNLSRLEKLCLDRLDDIGPSLVYILLKKDSLPKGFQYLCNTYPLVLPFSHNFILQITRSHVNSMKKSMHDNQTANFNLQNQILRNMEKDLLEKEQKYIIVPTQLLRQNDEWYIFTCSHMFPKEEFNTLIMNQFYNRVKNLITLLSQSKDSGIDVQSILLSVHFIDQEYHSHIKYGSGISCQSCPVCIYNYLCGRYSRKYSSLFKDDVSLLWKVPTISSLGNQ